MSYILDALKKSERERTLVRGVGFSDAGRRFAPRSRWTPRTMVMVAVIAVIALLALVLLRGHMSSTTVAAGKPIEIRPESSAEPGDTRNATAATMPPLLPVAGDAKQLVDMSSDFQRSVPAMQVNIHVYSPEESQRILYINNRQFRRGDEVANGVRVEEIVPDGVVLQYRGQRFKLPRPS